MEELKRCPFCGGFSRLKAEYNHRYDQWYFYAECTQCGVEQKYYSMSREDAIEEWNRRVEKQGRLFCRTEKRLWDDSGDVALFRYENRWYCSECGKSYGFLTSKPDIKYCSECGAKMEQEAEK